MACLRSGTAGMGARRTEMAIGEIEDRTEAESLGELRGRFRGALLRPGEEGYGRPGGSGTARSTAGRR